MKKSRILISAVLISAVALFSSGCNSEKNLSKAIENNQNLKSYSFNMNYDIKDNAITDNDGGFQGLQNQNMKINGDVVQEKDKNVKINMNTSYNVMGNNINLNLISMVNIPKNSYEIYMKVPETLKKEVEKVNKNAEYLYIGSDTMKKMEQKMTPEEKKNMPKTDVNQMANSITSFQNGIGEFFKEYISEGNKDVFKDDGEKDTKINGNTEKVHFYKIKMSDKDFKEFLKKFIKSKDKNKDLEVILKNILPKDKDGNIDYAKSEDEINKMPKIIGDKGANIEIGIKDKYIVKENVDVDLIMNNGEKINYNIGMTMFNLNKKMNINIPKKDSKVMDFFDYITKLINLDVNNSKK